MDVSIGGGRMTVKTQRGTAACGGAILAGLMAISLVGIKPAGAQGLSSYPNAPWSVTAGLYLPSNGTTRDQLAIDWLSYGASYDFKSTGTRTPSTYSVYLDYFNQVKTTTVTDALLLRSQAKMAGLGIADRYYFVPKYAPFQPYVGAGFGFYDVHADVESGGGSASEYKSAVGAKFLAGAQISSGIFLQGEYNWIPEPKIDGNRIHLSGYQLRAGYRF
jgi:hypothetical protein